MPPKCRQCGRFLMIRFNHLWCDKCEAPLHDCRWEYSYYQDEDDASVIFAIGRCYLCCKEALMCCSCGGTFMVRAGYFVCPSCDYIGAMVWPPIQQTTNESTCGPIEPPDETQAHGVA